MANDFASNFVAGYSIPSEMAKADTAQQTAELQKQYAPEIAKATVEKTVAEGQKASLEVQKMVKNMADDSFIAEESKAYFTNPENQKKPPDQQAIELARIAGKAGKVEQSEKYYKSAMQMQELMARSAKERAAAQSAIMDAGRTAIDAVSSDGSNWNNVKDMALKQGVEPEAIAAFEQDMKTMGPDKAKEKWHKLLTNATRQQAEEKERHDREQEKATREHQLEIERIRVSAQVKLEAAAQRKDDAAMERIAVQQNNQLINQNKQWNLTIKGYEEKKKALGSRPWVIGKEAYDDAVKEVETDIEEAKTKIKENNADIQKLNEHIKDKTLKGDIVKPVTPSSAREVAGKIGDKQVSITASPGVKLTPTQEDSVAKGIEAISKGAPREAVLKRLRDSGIKVQ